VAVEKGEMPIGELHIFALIFRKDIKEMQLKQVGWTGHVTCMRKGKIAYEIGVGRYGGSRRPGFYRSR
jgi:hypothetical protein